MNHLQLEEDARNELQKLMTCINALDYNDYTSTIPLLGNSTIGEHTRHVIEFFQSLFRGYYTGEINYDTRKRDVMIQTNIDFALESIAIIISEINRPNKDLLLTSHLLMGEEAMATNYRRELHYNIEHCIHHQAIIKIGLLVLGITNVDKSFGVSNATMRYREIEN